MATTKITVNNNGSLRIEGDFEIVDKAGNTYDLGGREIVSICRCGLSKNKPFCDGSHKGTDMSPVKSEATATRIVWFCGCKQSATPPFCDGTHKQL